MKESCRDKYAELKERVQIEGKIVDDELYEQKCVGNNSTQKKQKRRIVRNNTIQYNTIQYNTIQFNTIHYNAMQCNTDRKSVV